MDNTVHTVTLVRARNPDPAFPDYYTQSKLKNMQIMDCDNWAYSMGQWMFAYENRKEEFDYYIFSEDDYCFLKPNFDKFLVEAYEQKFPEGVGVLCSLIEYKPIVHFEGVIFVSGRTMRNLYAHPEFLGKPREFINNMEDKFQYNRSQYPGGYFQLAFSHMFTMAGIEHKTYTDTFPYWDDNTNRIIMYGTKDYNNHLYGPVQMAHPQYTSMHTGCKNILFIMGMHRCGTSFLTSCLVEQGYDLGKTKNEDKNWQNPHGYFENDRMTEFHEELLKFNGCSWHTLKRGKYQWTHEHVKRYRELIEDEFKGNRNVLIKDPRLSMFEDFLAEVCKEKYVFRIIFCTRDRMECCGSLCKAQNLSVLKAQEVYDISHEFFRDTMEQVNYRDVRNNTISWLDSSKLFDPTLYRQVYDTVNRHWLRSD